MKIMLDDMAYGLSRRRVTLSTAGMVPMLERLREECPVSLAVSLHAPNDALRNELVPLNRKYPIAELLAACKRYVEGDARRRVTIEYVMLAGVNDSVTHAHELVKILDGVPAKGEPDSVQSVPAGALRAFRPGHDRPFFAMC